MNWLGNIFMFCVLSSALSKRRRWKNFSISVNRANELGAVYLKTSGSISRTFLLCYRFPLAGASWCGVYASVLTLVWTFSRLQWVKQLDSILSFTKIFIWKLHCKQICHENVLQSAFHGNSIATEQMNRRLLSLINGHLLIYKLINQEHTQLNTVETSFILFIHVVKIIVISHYSLCVFAHWKLISLLIFHLFIIRWFTLLWIETKWNKWIQHSMWFQCLCQFLRSNRFDRNANSKPIFYLFTYYFRFYNFTYATIYSFIASLIGAFDRRGKKLIIIFLYPLSLLLFIPFFVSLIKNALNFDVRWCAAVTRFSTQFARVFFFLFLSLILWFNKYSVLCLCNVLIEH